MPARKFLVAVDESHVDSHDALEAARCFVTPIDKVVLLSVVPKTNISDSQKQHLIKTFVKYAEQDDQVTCDLAPNDGTSVAESFIASAKQHQADILFMGSGTKLSQGALGGVTNDLIRLSKRSVAVIKPGRALKPGKAKSVIYGTMGSEACSKGLQDVMSLLNPATDSITVVTVSHHEGDKDKEILNKARETVAGWQGKIDFTFVKRNAGNSVGYELLTFADAGEFNLLATATSRGSAERLGSTSAYIASHGAIPCLILKEQVTQ